jgi:hypothetical protein
LVVVAAWIAGGLVLLLCGCRAAAPGVLYLTDVTNRQTLIAVTPETVCTEPNLVIFTHGWMEPWMWPIGLAKTAAAQTDPQWRCGWYDWRREAYCLRPWDGARSGRDLAGPYLGEEIVRLSRQWRHIHLVGHSAGAWVINSAAQRIASETNADLHITFLDAYVPPGWEETILGDVAETTSRRFWVEQYYTRDFLFHIADTVLTNAHNVDITHVNRGHYGHWFPIIWYQATMTGRYKSSGWSGRKTVWRQAGDIEYGFARSLESGSQNWLQSLTLPAGGKPVEIRPGALAIRK